MEDGPFVHDGELYGKEEFVTGLLQSVRVPLGNLPDGRAVYVASEGLEILQNEPKVQEIVSKYGAKDLEELFYSGRFREKEPEALEEIMNEYQTTGLIFFEQIDHVPKPPRIGAFHDVSGGIGIKYSE
jgi:hypothetical protein